MDITIKHHPAASRLKGVKGRPSLACLLSLHEGRTLDMLSEIDRLTQENAALQEQVKQLSASYAQGIRAERHCIEGEVRWRAARFRDAARLNPSKSGWLGMLANECDNVAAMISRRSGGK